MDELFLIGDRTARVESTLLAEKGGWEAVLRTEREEEEGEEVGNALLGRELCVPRKNFYFRNAVRGVTEGLPGERFVEDTARGLVIPD